MAGRGLGIGLVFQPLLGMMLAGLPAGQLADANTLFSVGQRLGGSIGVSLLCPFSRCGYGVTAPSPVFHDTIGIAIGVAVLGVVCALFLPALNRAGRTGPRRRARHPHRR